jgi:hypothetical protein
MTAEAYLARSSVIAPESVTKTYEGAAIFESAGGIVDGFRSGEPLAIGGNVAAAGLSLLGAVMDPVQEVFAAGVGWLMEHVSLLREPLDRLAGDPKAVEGHAKSWRQAEVASCEQRGPVSTKGFGRWQSCTASVFWDDGDNEYVYGTEMFTSADIGTPVRVGEVGRHRTEPVLARADAGERPWLRWIGYLVLIIAIPPGLLTTLLLSAMLRSRKR